MPSKNYLNFTARAPGVEAMERLLHSVRGVLFCTKDRERRYLCANEAFLSHVGINDKAQLLGRTAREIFPALHAAGYEQQDSAILNGGREMHDRLEMITRPGGAIGWYLSDKVAVRDLKGEIIGIASISRDLRIPANDDPRIAQLAKAITRMREDYAEPLRITELAKSTGMSLSKFERLMRSILAVSARQLLTRLRVEAAAEQLRSTDHALGDIALDCGFCDQPTFCRQFKTRTGMTASRYRELSRD